MESYGKRWSRGSTPTLLFFFIFVFVLAVSQGLALSTRSRWVVDEAKGGPRVKLACANWASHLQPMLAEGLSKQPLQSIADSIHSLGFTCVRLTWATFMFTRPSLSSRTVRQSFSSLNLTSSLVGISTHNPQLLDLPVVEAYAAVIDALGLAGVLVILDNHISTPQWCCGYDDGNGFFGDRNFSPSEWINGLVSVATAFKSSPHVIAMSLRNELRGWRENAPDWFKYMSMGAEAIHKVNPNLLIIHSGLSYDTDLSFLSSSGLKLNESGIKNKVIFEIHWYGFSSGDAYAQGNLNTVCAAKTADLDRRAAFVTSAASSTYLGSKPLFVSEFGLNLAASTVNEDRYFTCISAFLAGGDFEWAYWPLQGSYYIRNGVLDLDETFGILNAGWDAPRNASFLRRIQALQRPFITNPNSIVRANAKAGILFHPASGLCVGNFKIFSNVELHSCQDVDDKWIYNNSTKELQLVDTYLCMSIDIANNGQPVSLRTCGSATSGEGQQWDIESEMKLQYATYVQSELGTNKLCLEGKIDPSGTFGGVIAQDCLCIQKNECTDGKVDPSMQWFKLIPTSFTHHISSKIEM